MVRESQLIQAVRARSINETLRGELKDFKFLMKFNLKSQIFYFCFIAQLLLHTRPPKKSQNSVYCHAQPRDSKLNGFVTLRSLTYMVGSAFDGKISFMTLFC